MDETGKKSKFIFMNLSGKILLEKMHTLEDIIRNFICSIT